MYFLATKMTPWSNLILEKVYGIHSLFCVSVLYSELKSYDIERHLLLSLLNRFHKTDFLMTAFFFFCQFVCTDH